MMLFELVSGRRNSEQAESDGKLKYYPSMATCIIVKRGNLLCLLDERLEGGPILEGVIERVPFTPVRLRALANAIMPRSSLSSFAQLKLAICLCGSQGCYASVTLQHRKEKDKIKKRKNLGLKSAALEAFKRKPRAS
ncbi:hypothetical protein TIFTF001_030333 [Ficus carica]|uniref:Uncharacterized protein n=1 Tax=Ficus carica TaxID=3494 RepID=A0AA88DSZ3_FICCA|nr:hypothetical protein TIFTF001_030333 [Ficus carica]